MPWVPGTGLCWRTGPVGSQLICTVASYKVVWGPGELLGEKVRPDLCHTRLLHQNSCHGHGSLFPVSVPPPAILTAELRPSMLCRHPLKARGGVGRPQVEGGHETWGYQPAASGSTGNGSSLGSGYGPSIYLRGGGKPKAGTVQGWGPVGLRKMPLWRPPAALRAHHCQPLHLPHQRQRSPDAQQGHLPG